MLPKSGPTKPRGQAARSRKRFSWLSFFVGALCGVTVAAIGFGLVYAFFPPLVPTTSTPVACPATPDLVVICPQVVPPVVVTATPPPTNTPTRTPTRTATPNLAATATAACATFRSQFPATPCQ